MPRVSRPQVYRVVREMLPRDLVAGAGLADGVQVVEVEIPFLVSPCWLGSHGRLLVFPSWSLMLPSVVGALARRGFRPFSVP